MAFTDENLLKAIIRNLVNNAIKFTPPKGNVLISGDMMNAWVILKISDSGIGIKKEDLPFIFSTPKLQQGTSGEKGTGLGLILCKDLIEQNGGKISISSVFGEGSTFEIALPVSTK